ncbi:MAG: proton-conducting transporter membrane subunit [Ketobacteraceae bacterium]|nr:proton-conducting transporter membrane subunit [Ketobacteraceae bacterium]
MMDLNTALPVWIPLISFITGGVIFFIDEKRHGLRTFFNLLSAMLVIGLVAFMVAGVAVGKVYEFRFPLLYNIDLVLRADKLSLLFVVLSSVLWLVTTIYAVGYLEKTPHRSRFFGFFSLCVGATIGIALAGNMVTFLLFYELLTIVTYPLVVHRGNEASLKAGRIYLTYTIIGGTCLLIGVVWLKSLVGNLDFVQQGILVDRAVNDWHLQAIFWLIIGGLGVKAALGPLHGWLPEAMAAPAPVSALLHAVAVVKAGAFGIVRVVYDVYGVELATDLGLLMPLVFWACITIVYGSVRALGQNDLKKRLAFSTVSQVSYIALGTAMAGPIAAVGGMVHLVHQGLMKITLFFCAGVYAETLGIHKISEMNGVGRRMPLTTLCFTAASLGMIGVPPMAGFVTKWYLASGAMASGYDWVILVLVTSSLLNAAYFLPILYRAWFLPQDQEWHAHGHDEEHHAEQVATDSSPRRWEAREMLLFPPVITALAALFCGLLAGYELSPLSWATLIVEMETLTQVGRLAPALVQGQDAWLLAIPLSPLIALLLAGSHPATRSALPTLAVLAVVPALLAALVGEPGGLQLSAVLLGAELRLDDTSRWWLLLAAVIWLLGAAYGKGYLRDSTNADSYWIFFLLACTGNLGLVLAANAPTFLPFFALMGFASFGLIVHQRTEQAFRAGRWYMRMVILNELMVFAGVVIITAFTTGLVSKAVSPAVLTGGLWILMLGFGIKAGLMPLHLWLPLAHPMAPTPASAILSGAMLKAGVIGWTRFIPPELAAEASAGTALIVLGMGGSLLAALIGITQNQAKAALAYSSVSQMGLISVVIGVGFYQPSLWPMASLIALIFALHHAICKAALFFTIGIYPSVARHHRRWIFWGTVIVMASIAGAPVTSGAVAKALLKGLSEEIGSNDWAHLKSLLWVGSLLTTCLMCRYAWLLTRTTDHHGHGPDGWVLGTWLTALTGAAATPVVLLYISELLVTTSPLKWLSLSALQPILVVLLITAGVLRWGKKLTARWNLEVPPGDWMNLLEWLGKRRLPLSRRGIHFTLADSTLKERLVRWGREFGTSDQIAFEWGLQAFFVALMLIMLYGFWITA